MCVAGLLTYIDSRWGSYSKLPSREGRKTSSQSVHTDGRENRITQEIKALGGLLESPKRCGMKKKQSQQLLHLWTAAVSVSVCVSDGQVSHYNRRYLEKQLQPRMHLDEVKSLQTGAPLSSCNAYKSTANDVGLITHTGVRVVNLRHSKILTLSSFLFLIVRLSSGTGLSCT